MSLDAILARDDYKRMTSLLKDRVNDIAERIREKMNQLDVDEITKGGVTVALYCKSSNVGDYHYLAIETYDEDCDYPLYSSLNDMGRCYCYGGDFYAKIVGASNKDGLSFLNAAREIIEYLGRIESEKADEIKKALEENADL